MVNSRADVTSAAKSNENQNIHANFDFVGSWKQQTNDKRAGSTKPCVDPDQSLHEALSQDIYMQRDTYREL